ncbi:hypothetical protein CEP54_011121 [Fusarium duplospermum]|uniref:C2H2-type domain-containing protein n=1 Tax=Fusarium duplospermum TaxID=1325734 RepID=A0A428PG30_9HYPO|nr:hypothetical protein CEP54_011121 [Fusarium duplospermum]
MRCNLPPHREALAFKTYDEYEVHYNKSHTNRCLECRKNFPSEHLLNVHIEECHDPLVTVKREKGEHTVSSSPRPFLHQMNNRFDQHGIVLLLRGRM